jgi:DNA-binding SARP family transcriptional activator
VVEFRLLGPLEVRDGERVIQLPRHKQRALLGALLLRAGRVVSKDELLEDLWGATPPAQAESSLQNLLSQLRKALGPDTVVTKAPGYLLRVEPDQIDVARFERLVAEGRRAEPGERAAKLREALSLVRGENLADLRFETFAQTEIRRLDELELNVREELLRAELELGNETGAVPELDALVGAHPFREGLRYLLMLALYRSGRQADALAAYRDARAALVEELGIEPGEELQELERAILRQDPTLRGSAPAAQESPPGTEGPLALARAQRKTVTVLVVSSRREPARNERDPESLRRAEEQFAAVAVPAIERYGGTSERTGDAVTGFFGIPAVHEDDPLRAVRAAAELRDALVAREVEAGLGVATGAVLVEGGGRPGATGEVIRRAAALARSAGVGEILMSVETSELLAGTITVAERVPAVSVRLDGIGSDAGPRMLRLDARLVGRDHELGALTGALENASEQETCHLFTLVGEAGVGKTRLVAEFLSSVGAAVTVALARCLPYGSSGGMAPLREALRDEVDEDVSTDGIRRVLESLAQERPLVLVVDDAHCAEPGLLDVVEHVVERSRGAPILLVCVARPELFDLRPAWGGGKPNAHALFLQPLPPHESEALVDDLLGESDLPQPVRAHIVGAAGGNPLFLEELLATLVDRSVLRREGGRWTTQELPVLRIPPTIQALIAARIDRVPDDERLVLELGSIEGTIFGTGTIDALAPAHLRSSADELLGRLVSRELIRPAGSPGVYVFRHQLVRDAAYESTPKARRAELHERFAESAADPGERRDYHLEQALAYRRELEEPAAPR